MVGMTEYVVVAKALVQCQGYARNSFNINLYKDLFIIFIKSL